MRPRSPSTPARRRDPARVLLHIALAVTLVVLGLAALRYLRQSIAAREPLALTLRIDPLLRRLHRDPEFRRLAERVGRPG